MFFNQKLIKIVTFEYVIGHKAGLLITNIEDTSVILFTLNEDFYTQF